MSEYRRQDYLLTELHQTKAEKFKSYSINAGLFLATFITTLIAGAEWTTTQSFWTENFSFNFTWAFLSAGLPYSLSILFIITCHEFGHYFAARYHKVKVTLPFYIPFPPIPGVINFGTMGAVIRTKTPVNANKAMFDIGVYGPIAGFVAVLIVLIYGFMNVPGEEYLLRIHPDYFSPEYGAGMLSLTFGDTLLFSFFRSIFVEEGQFFPPMSEIYHYPFLCVGWFGLFITSMNMIPIGQLDGGHISYTMFGDKIHTNIAYILFILLFLSGLLGLIDSYMELNLDIAWPGWLFWALILYFLIKIKHPPIPDDRKLDNKRMMLGIFSFIIFIVSFSPVPIRLSM
jgi:membrane-associated protease RseP (regulator of RpoE activity)